MQLVRAIRIRIKVPSQKIQFIKFISLNAIFLFFANSSFLIPLFDDRYMLPAISRQFAAMSTCRPSCSRLNFNERASPLLKGYVIERRSCDLAPMLCFLPPPVNLPIGTSIGVPTAMRALQPSSARHRCRREVIVTTFLVIGRGGRLACLPPSQFRLARGRPCARVMASSGPGPL